MSDERKPGDLASDPWRSLLTPMIFSSSGPDLALRAQAGFAAHAPAPSHLRPLPVSRNSAWQAAEREPRREGGRERSAQRREGVTVQQAARESVVDVRGRVASRLQAKLQATTHGLANECPTSGRRRCGLAHRPRRVSAYSPPGWVAFWIRTSGAVSEERRLPAAHSLFFLVVMRSFASSVVRYLGDRPRWLRYRLRLADSVDVSYRGFPEITVLRFVRDVWTFLKDSEVNGCVKQLFGNFDCATMTRLVPHILLADDFCAFYS